MNTLWSQRRPQQRCHYREVFSTRTSGCRGGTGLKTVFVSVCCNLQHIWQNIRFLKFFHHKWFSSQMILNGIHMSRIYAKGGLNPWNGPTELGQQLKTAKSKVPSKDLLILFYITCIRPVVEYMPVYSAWCPRINQVIVAIVMYYTYNTLLYTKQIITNSKWFRSELLI